MTYCKNCKFEIMAGSLDKNGLCFMCSHYGLDWKDKEEQKERYKK